MKEITKLAQINYLNKNNAYNAFYFLNMFNNQVILALKTDICCSHNYFDLILLA